jgi:hypothetical protein
MNTPIKETQSCSPLPLHSPNPMCTWYKVCMRRATVAFKAKLEIRMGIVE